MAAPTPIRRIVSLKTAAQFSDYCAQIGADIPLHPELISGSQNPLSQSAEVDGLSIRNRWAVLPMEGWDGTADGHPSELTFRRWERFGSSGAGLIWGGEATAVRHDGRANARQVIINPQTAGDITRLREALVKSWQDAHGSTGAPVTGLQLTHSGRFCRPNSPKLEPMLAYDHPILNARFNLPEESGMVMSDAQLEDLFADFARAGKLAQECGFDFVDVKHCHGYLLHEFLSAVTRPGPYGGSFENRTRPAREIINAIRREAPGLRIGVRLSAFDLTAFHMGEDRVGVPVQSGPGTPFRFGGDETGLGIDLREPILFLEMLREMGVHLICITGGSPYYNPHVQRPAYYPPSDGYKPPEDPLVGAARLIQAAATLKRAVPGVYMVGTGYSCLQEWLPNVAQAAVGEQMIDAVGLGRSMLSYPTLPLDVLEGRPANPKILCRTFSDCTTAPRNGLVSGCYPIDHFYKESPEAEQLGEIKKQQRLTS